MIKIPGQTKTILLSVFCIILLFCFVFYGNYTQTVSLINDNLKTFCETSQSSSPKSPCSCEIKPIKQYWQPRDLETFAVIQIFACNKPPYNPVEPNPPPSGDGQGHFGNPWKPRLNHGDDIMISVVGKDARDTFNDSKDAGVWFKCAYVLWNGTAGIYQQRMNVSGGWAEISLGGNISTNFLVIGGTYVKWYINASCDRWSPHCHLSSFYEYTVGGLWKNHDFNQNIYFNISNAFPKLGEDVNINVKTKNSSISLIDKVRLYVEINYPNSTKIAFDAWMEPNGTYSEDKDYTIPSFTNQNDVGTVVYLNCTVLVYAGYDVYYNLTSHSPIAEFTVVDTVSENDIIFTVIMCIPIIGILLHRRKKKW